jgi:hypothetical protein
MKHYIANPLSNLELKLTRLTIFHKITLTIYEIIAFSGTTFPSVLILRMKSLFRL